MDNKLKQRHEKGRILVVDDNRGIRDTLKILLGGVVLDGGGTGVGLSLARQMVRMNDGQISLASSDSEKTVFTMVF